MPNVNTNNEQCKSYDDTKKSPDYLFKTFS